MLVVGEAPGRTEKEQGKPFVGPSGRLLETLLGKAGLTSYGVTNVCNENPRGNDIRQFFKVEKKGTPGDIWRTYPTREILQGLLQLRKTLQDIRPKLILALGDVALWALTEVSEIRTEKGKRLPKGIGLWRGSHLTLRSDYEVGDIPVIPTYHPAFVLRMPSWGPIVGQDFFRARRLLEGKIPPKEPDYAFTYPASFEATMSYLERVESGVLAIDIETFGGTITVLGLSKGPHEALSLPLYVPGRGPWLSAEEEILVARRLREVTRDVRVVGQNFLFDAQYLSRNWGLYVMADFDTMIAQGVLFPGFPVGTKGLDTLSSFYCDHHYFWKKETKSYDPREEPERLWLYNCRDVRATYEIAMRQSELLYKKDVLRQFSELMGTARACFNTMLRGVRIDTKEEGRIREGLEGLMAQYEEFFKYVVPEEVMPLQKTPWWRSDKQLRELFHERLGLPPIRRGKEHRITLDDDALHQLGKRKPAIKPICDALRSYRSCKTVLPIVQGKYDRDGRIRCSYNPVGTYTYRLSSSSSAFGSGTNLQNITAGRDHEEDSWDPLRTGMPNLRKLLCPDEGYVIVDADLDRADLVVVIWEADDQELKAMVREHANIHEENAKVLFPGQDYKKSSSHTSPYYKAKTGVHATNYGATPPVLARHLGITVKEAEAFQKRWFEAHPGIRKWHQSVELSLMTKGIVQNIFGYKVQFFGRLEDTLKEALAWIPQSTVALVTNEGWRRIDVNLPEVEVLLQVHDSLIFQRPKDRPTLTQEALNYMQVELPYDDPVIIPVKAVESEISWGDCK